MLAFLVWASGLCCACGLADTACHSDPLVRVCLERPTPFRIRMIALASKSYHALKFVHKNDICRAVSSNSFGPVQVLLADVARHFARDMGMV